MSHDVCDYVSVYDVCTRSKASYLPSVGLLHPLPVPSRPWSHIAVDFVTGLPPSEGNTIILTIIDRFSKNILNLLNMFSVCMASQQTLCPIVGLNPLSGLEGILSSPWCFLQHLIRFSSPVKWMVRECQPRSGYCPAVCNCPSSYVWSSFLPWIEYAHNSMTSSAIGMSPFMASMGHQLPVFPGRGSGSPLCASPPSSMSNLSDSGQKTCTSLSARTDTSVAFFSGPASSV